MLENLRVVLVGTSHPGNIGAAARAMKTMGLQRLVLVAPEAFPHREASAMAAGADDVLDAAEVHPDLESALADCRVVLGCTARRRSVALPELEPRAAAAELLAAAARAPTALVFGRERTGLTNEELQRCHAAVHIPANPDYSSLNIAAAVQVLSYEVRMAHLEMAPPPASAARPADAEAAEPATQAQLEGFFGQLEQTLSDIDFHKGREPAIVMQRLRRLFLRAQPDPREVRILRGILADAQRMARLAREAGQG
jgi:tRNA (cytidine32/uridine32-2'-O)-methyltransferase